MSTKLIPGLPNYKKILLESKPLKKGEKWIKATNANIQILFDGRYAIGATPIKGKPKKSVWIVETGYPGFTVVEYHNPKKTLGYGYRNAEKLMIRLALAGYKVVNY